MTDLNLALLEAIEEVLTTMFFETPEPASAEAMNEPSLRVEMAFRGHRAGKLCLRASTDVLGEMAANFLGVDSPGAVPGEARESAAKELANMICGALLSRLESPGLFELLPPELLPPEIQAAEPANESRHPKGTQWAEQNCAIGAGQMRITFVLSGAA